MTIFALDTSSEWGSMALRRDGKLIREEILRGPDGHADRVFEAIQQFQEELSLDLRTVDCFAAAAGPGSFTGVRVGLTAVKGLAEAFGKRALGISNLRSLASFGRTVAARRAVILDARRSQVYAALYDRELRLVSPEIVQSLPEWLHSLDRAAQYEFLSPVNLDLSGTPFAGMPVTEVPRELAGAVAWCAELDGGRGKWLDPSQVDANYVRRSDAELFWQDSR